MIDINAMTVTINMGPLYQIGVGVVAALVLQYVIIKAVKTAHRI